MITVETIEAALGRRQPSRMPLGGFMQQAAVAVVARDTPAGAELLLIHRAERDGDPWSGHVAFPGGRLEPHDPDAEAAAARETREEIGLDLRASGHRLGELAELMAKAHGRLVPMVIHPFVYGVGGELGPFHLSDEVQAVMWVPLAFLMEKANRGTFAWKMAGVSLELPCYRFDEKVLWGLTLRMVDELLTLLQ